MKLSPNYEAIRDRAIEILQAPSGYNGFTSSELKKMLVNPDGLTRSMTVDGALVQAKAEIEPGPGACRSGVFNLGNFEKAALEVRKHFRSKARK